MREALENSAVWAHMQALRWTHWRPFVNAACDPRATQTRLLLGLLQRNRDTTFGHEHNFAAISRYKEFADAVQVQTYESLRPYIETQQQTGEPTLTASPPVLFAQTSGTTGKPKLIPLIAETLEAHKRTQSTQASALFAVEPDIFYGRILGIVSPAVEGHLANGTPFGSASGHVSRTMPRRARKRYVLPDEALEISDYESKYQVIVALALACSDLTCIATANPSTLLKLVSVFREHRETLLRHIVDGTLPCPDRLTPSQRSAILPRIQCSGERIAELKALLRVDNPSVSDLWPRLRLITTWTGGSCSIPLNAVRNSLPDSVHIAELGYMSSEFRGTITVESDTSAGAPTIQQNFFEFVERTDWDSGQRNFQTIEELDDGRQYYIFVTTSGGLYRYFMNDIVEAGGRFHNTPCIRFVEKGSGVTNITGEKLHESQVIKAVCSVEERLGHSPVFFVMLADAHRSTYRLYIERQGSSTEATTNLRDAVERELSAGNVEYEQKLKSGRLKPLEVVALERGAGHAYKRHFVQLGQRENQFKVVVLQYADSCTFPFANFALERPAE